MLALGTQRRRRDDRRSPRSTLGPAAPVQYGGSRRRPQALIVSDLPLQGDSRQRSLQMNDAIQLVLEGANWKAGGRNVAFQACDDSLADTGLWSKAIARRTPAPTPPTRPCSA